MATKAAPSTPSTGYQVSFTAKHLQDLLRTVKPFVTTRASGIEAFKHVRVHYDGEGDLCIEGTQLYASVRAWADDDDAEGDKRFDVLLPFKDLEALAKSGGPTVTLVDEADHVRVSVGRRTSKLAKGRMDDWPKAALTFEKPRDVVVHAVGAEFADIVASCARYASADETRPIFTGIVLDGELDPAKAIATDTYTLGVFDLEGRVAKRKVNVPARELLAATRKLTADEGVLVEADESTACVRRAGAAYVLRLIDGPFPNWQPVVEGAKAEFGYRVDQQALLDAFTDAAAALKANQPVHVHLEREQLRLTATTEDGAFEIKVPVIAADWSKDAEAAEKAVKAKVGGPYTDKAKAEAGLTRAQAKAPRLLYYRRVEKARKHHIVPDWPIEIGMNASFARDVVWSLYCDEDGAISVQFGTPLTVITFRGVGGQAAQMPIRLKD